MEEEEEDTSEGEGAAAVRTVSEGKMEEGILVSAWNSAGNDHPITGVVSVFLLDIPSENLKFLLFL